MIIFKIMRNLSKWTHLSLTILTVAVFLIFLIPNSQASENIAMVSMFEPDEGIMIPVIQRMITHKGNLKHTLIYFVLYRYYYYGFPFFASSALVILPFQWLNQMGNIQWIMISLRQLISVLPMLLALLLLVYIHDRFKTYRSVLLLVFLLLVPAVIRNGFWWHPDGIVLLLSSVVLYFLYSDQHQLGWHFLTAGFFCGILTATKLVGGYFFLAVGLAIIWSLAIKQVTWKKAIGKSFAFIAIMAAAFILSNPFLLIQADRLAYITTFQKQTELLSAGYNIVYDRGLRAAWPVMRQFYGEAIFIIITLGITIWNIISQKTRFLHALIMAWFLPLTISVLTFSHFKYQYWLPVALPLFCNWVTIFPDQFELKSKTPSIGQVIKTILMVIFLVQLVLFGIQSTQMLIKRTTRKANSAEITFYNQAIGLLEPIGESPVYAYYDYRLYLPAKQSWISETTFGLLDYDLISARGYDVLFLLQQRIWDYLNPNAVGVDPESFAQSQAFYQDANKGGLAGYHLLYRNETALLFIRQDVCMRYFEADTCQ